jgi:hypothetical protein
LNFLAAFPFICEDNLFHVFENRECRFISLLAKVGQKPFDARWLHSGLGMIIAATDFIIKVEVSAVVIL